MATVDKEQAEHDFASWRVNFVAHLNLKLEEVGEGAARVRLPYCDQVTNATGAVHGGAIVSLCDSSAYVALASIFGRKQQTTTSQISCSFLGPALPPHDLIAEAKVLKPGRRIVYVEVYVRSGDRLIAHATVNFLNTPPTQT